MRFSWESHEISMRFSRDLQPVEKIEEKGSLVKSMLFLLSYEYSILIIL